MMDIGMYGSEHYQVGEMASTSSTYNYYPNYHNHSHLHHHHMHPNPTAEILSGFSAQNHAPNQTAPVINATNHSLSLYHEYGITMSNPEQAFYDSDSGMAQMYYPNQSNSGDHHGISSSSHQTTPTSVSSSSNDVLSETAPSHIISSDNGLSYTNLDYMYGGGHANPLYLHQPDDKSAIAHPYNHSSPTANLESSLHPQQHSTVWQSQHQSPHTAHPHQPPGYLENPVNAHQIGVGQVACIQNQTPLGASGSNGIHGRTLNSRADQVTSQQNSQNQPQHGQTVQTYKWMQVKRNVPKPPGKFETRAVNYTVFDINVENMENY